jgi:hypothetical protein
VPPRTGSMAVRSSSESTCTSLRIHGSAATAHGTGQLPTGPRLHFAFSSHAAGEENEMKNGARVLGGARHVTGLMR